MEAGPLLGLEKKSRILICCAHPDDEMSLLNTIQALVKEGHSVYLVFGTSGEASSAKVQGIVREKESQKAMAALGVDKNNLMFLRLPDGGLVDHFPALVDGLRKTIDQLNPHVLMVVAFEGGHLDHDSMNAAAFFARRGTSSELYEFPTYHRDGVRMVALKFPRKGPKAGPILYYKVFGQLNLYETIKPFYASQVPGLEKFEKVVNLKHREKNGESFRFVPRDRVYNKAPGTRPLLYEVMPFPKRRTFHEFVKVVQGYLMLHPSSEPIPPPVPKPARTRRPRLLGKPLRAR